MLINKHCRLINKEDTTVTNLLELDGERLFQYDKFATINNLTDLKKYEEHNCFNKMNEIGFTLYTTIIVERVVHTKDMKQDIKIFIEDNYNNLYIYNGRLKPLLNHISQSVDEIHVNYKNYIVEWYN